MPNKRDRTQLRKLLRHDYGNTRFVDVQDLADGQKISEYVENLRDALEREEVAEREELALVMAAAEECQRQLVAIEHAKATLEEQAQEWNRVVATDLTVPVSTKGLKVYGWSALRDGKQTREVVAAKSVAEVLRITGMTRYTYSHTGYETANDVEIQVAMSTPGRVFWRPADALEGAKWQEL